MSGHVNEQAREWMREQCARLGVTPSDIIAAVLRGWCGEEIAALPAANAGDLAGPPPLDPVIAQGIERIRRAQIIPVDPDVYGKNTTRPWNVCSTS